MTAIQVTVILATQPEPEPETRSRSCFEPATRTMPGRARPADHTPAQRGPGPEPPTRAVGGCCAAPIMHDALSPPPDPDSPEAAATARCPASQSRARQFA